MYRPTINKTVCQSIFGLVGHGLLGYSFPSFLRKLRSEFTRKRGNLNIKLTKYLHSHTQIKLYLSFIRTIYLHRNVKIFPRRITMILKNTFNKQLPIKNYLLDRDSNL